MNTKSLILIVLPSLLFITGCSAQCDRDCVVASVDNYVAALVAHDPAGVDLSDTVKITENGQVVPVGEGVWQSITRQGGYRQTFVDQDLRSAVFFGAFEEGDDPLLLAIRFAFDSNGKITEVENLTSRYDSRNRLISRHQLTEPNPVYDTVLPEGERASRQQLIDAAHTYFDGIANSTDEGVPIHPECNRRENGVLLLQNKKPETEPCPIGFHRFNYITDIRDRRVAVVDEERGLVLVWAFFDVPGNIEVAPGPWGPSDLQPADGEQQVDSRRIPRSLYIAELFRVVDGGIRDIEAIMFNLDLGATSGWE